MSEIIWFEMAQADLINIHSFIATDDKRQARKIVKLLVTSIQQLMRFPLMGRAGRVATTRELIIPKTPFIVVYRFVEKKDEVQILTILHTAQMYPT